MQNRELSRTEDGRLRHEMFPEEIGVLHHGALQWLKNDAALFQLIRNYVPLNKLIAGENHAASDFIKPARLFQDRGASVLTQCPVVFERRQIKKSDIRKPPSLIFSGRLW